MKKSTPAVANSRGAESEADPLPDHVVWLLQFVTETATMDDDELFYQTTFATLNPDPDTCDPSPCE